MSFEILSGEDKKKKKRAKNEVFMRNFHLGKCVQKRARKGVFPINFHFGKCLKKTGQHRFEINAICMLYETLCGDKFEKLVSTPFFF